MITSHLYTAEGADSARQSEKDKSTPDPTPEQAKAAIESNTFITTGECDYCHSSVDASLLIIHMNKNEERHNICKTCWKEGKR